MYIGDNKTGLEKALMSVNAACAAFFRVSGKTLRSVARFLAGEANQNRRCHREVNS